VANHREHPRIITERLGGRLSLFCVRLIVDHFCDDLCSEKAARCIPLIDCEIDRLTYLDAESRRGGRQWTGDADADFLAVRPAAQTSAAAKIAENLIILTSHI
jgi:hypothetical protein